MADAAVAMEAAPATKEEAARRAGRGRGRRGPGPGDASRCRCHLCHPGLRLELVRVVVVAVRVLAEALEHVRARLLEGGLPVEPRALLL